MSTLIEEQIEKIEKEIFDTQKNKATEHHIGRLKAKIAKLRDSLQKEKSSKKGGGKGFAVKKSGDATVGIVGFPSVGKSTLLNKITTGTSTVGNYDFTTLDVIPGMMNHMGAKIQILDLPGLIDGASNGRGRGKEILSAVRNVDLILLMIGSTSGKNQIDIMKKELHNAGIRLNEHKPDIIIKKKNQGGITVNKTLKLTHLNDNVAKAVISEYVINADVTIREDVNEDRLIDFLSKNRIYVPAIVVLNKIDLINSQDVLEKTIDSLRTDNSFVVPISARINMNLNELKNMIFESLNRIRVYLKPIDGKADYNEPLILKKEATVQDTCRIIHRDFTNKFKHAFIWGKSAKYNGQRVGLSHVLQDEDILTIVTKN
ncbi:small GTP-binding protein [Thermoplasmatales archaeon SCGC AB-539-N05]|nr:small GTP-binding protein [Thermoplasmatales archaeon SCGC AB-539-N05]